LHHPGAGAAHEIQQDAAAKAYDLVFPGITADGTINPELQKRVLGVRGSKSRSRRRKFMIFLP
jgi:hypothetical protein